MQKETKPKKKKKMSTAACKAKGRRLQNWIAEHISEITEIPCGKDCLIQSREMGQSGVDVKLIQEALEKYPFSVEAKNSEKWNINAAVEQAKKNQMENTNWQVFLSKNRFDPIVVMDAKVFFSIWKEILDSRKDK